MKKENKKRIKNIPEFDRLSYFCENLSVGLQISCPDELKLKEPEGTLFGRPIKGKFYVKSEETGEKNSTCIELDWKGDLIDEWTLCHEFRHMWQDCLGKFDTGDTAARREFETFEDYLGSPREVDAEAFAYLILQTLYGGTAEEDVVEQMFLYKYYKYCDIMDKIIRCTREINLDDFRYDFLYGYEFKEEHCSPFPELSSLTNFSAIEQILFYAGRKWWLDHH